MLKIWPCGIIADACLPCTAALVVTVQYIQLYEYSIHKCIQIEYFCYHDSTFAYLFIDLEIIGCFVNPG